ncbi:DNA polymerase III subunit gamma/tau [Crenalkalicoccus roseus]|uniref:DNA polymerase III subunit gamma/tau n=1 Tax=Crenalkalicoccus roseus TaxID=1485588 RepID=UPI001081DF48|nr:DNA polymerase III subunit gamma/tau [Crenalkalicoccus roseus]
MASDLFGSAAPSTEAPPEEAERLPEPPPPEGPGLFGDAPAAPPAEAAPYRVLARKYRPTTFAELIGQEALVRTLRNAFAQNRVPHAFLLTGVRGVGKTTTARIIARALNCVGPDGRGGPTVDPCGTCPECRAILADRHPDVLELDAASNNSVDDVRELRETLRYRPAQGRFKVLILDEVHMLSNQAFNALLKTLEEPPAQVKFMLATTELRKVPTTIRSRCQTHFLRRVAQPALRAHFAAIAAKEGVAAEEEALAMLARAADGSVRDGLSLLDQAIALAGAEGTGVTAALVAEMLGLADRGLVMDLMEAAMRGDVAACLSLMDRAHERGADPGVILSDMLDLAHTLTRLASVPALRADPSLGEEERGRGAALAERLSIPVLGRAWQMLLKGLAEVNEAPDRRAAAEMVLIRLAHVAELPTPGDILRRLGDGGAAAGGSRPSPEGGPPAPAGSAARGSVVPDPPAGGALRAVAGGGPPPRLAPEPSARPAQAPRSWREVVALASGRRPMLHAHLLHSVHPVRIAEGRIEMRVRPEAPRDLAAQLGALLLEATGARWTIALSNAEGEPTLAEQGRAAEAERRSLAASHPLVQAVLAAFPGASIEAVRDAATDAYGLPLAASPPGAEAPGLAPPGGTEEPEAGAADFDDDFPPEDP